MVWGRDLASPGRRPCRWDHCFPGAPADAGGGGWEAEQSFWQTHGAGRTRRAGPCKPPRFGFRPLGVIPWSQGSWKVDGSLQERNLSFVWSQAPIGRGDRTLCVLPAAWLKQTWFCFTGRWYHIRPPTTLIVLHELKHTDTDSPA